MSSTKIKRFRLAAWHLGVLIMFVFLTLIIRHARLKEIDPSAASESFVGVVDKTIFDLRLRARGTRPMSGRVGILAIDEKSIAKFGRWPFSRNSYSDAFKNLKNAGVQFIGLDVLFTEPESPLLSDALGPMESILNQSLSPAGILDPQRFVQGITDLLATSPGDLSLSKAIQDFENVVQAVAIISPEEGEGVERNWQEARDLLSQSAASQVVRIGENFAERSDAFFPLMNTTLISGEKPIVGFINNSPDGDGIFRATKLVEEIPRSMSSSEDSEKIFLPSLNLQLAAKYLDRQIKVRYSDHIESVSLVDGSGNSLNIPLTRNEGELLLNHYGEHLDSKNKTTPVRISLADAADNIFPKEIPDILILGSTTLGIDDKRPSPVNASANGVEHHVAAVENIIQKDFLIRPKTFIVAELAVTIIIGLILCFLLSRSSAIISVVFLLLSHLAIELVDQKYLFGTGRVVNLGIFHLQNIAIFFVMIIFKFFVEEREKRKVKGAFQHYLNPSVINQLLDSPDGLKLGGEKKELTVFFSDVRGFTSISERLSPEALSGLLNEYFTPMTNIVLDSGGLLDKYIGDALMAVWGAPLKLPDHADRALHSSLRMFDALDKLREGWKERNLPTIDIGCGINTGPMVVGNMGSDQRFDYTVLGDAVNLGSRLEGITKEYGVRIICSDATRLMLQRPDDFVLRELDWIKVKGKNEPVTIYEVMRFTSEKKDTALGTKELFESGLRSYRQRDFDTAQRYMLNILKIAPQDGPAGVFMERCEYFKENPPQEDWDGVWVMKSK